jgi:hypothetical protein
MHTNLDPKWMCCYLGAQRGAVAFFRQHAFAFDDNKLGRANDSRFNVYV